MPVFHQMGNDTQNLIGDVPGYAGAIVSPVNSDSADVAKHVVKYQSETFRFIFDPQLYCPKSSRGQLRTWNYFPKELDTADLSSDSWWDGVSDELLKCVTGLNITSMCSPAVVPSTYTDDYYALVTRTASRLAAVAHESKVRVLQTVLVPLAELSDDRQAMQVASIVSATKAVGLYLVFVSEVEPRREYADADALRGAMRLINTLRNSGVEVHVGFTGPEMVLWKAAGATSCATGKFFNLRRFTRGRFEEEQSGGGLVAYWFEERLMASLRESDLARLRPLGFLDQTIATNQYGKAIVDLLQQKPGTPWVGLAWRQYMSWFSDVEARITSGSANVRDMLKLAEENWLQLEEKDLLMEEPRNDGKFLRAWRRALAEHTRA